jgi:hypothetical protein
LRRELMAAGHPRAYEIIFLGFYDGIVKALIEQ